MSETICPFASRESDEAFVMRWKTSGAAERANCQLFLTELCDLLNTPRPEPATPDDAANTYVFERSVTFNNGDGTTSPGRIDLYKRGCFVLEAKQGADKDSGDAPLSAAGRQRKAKRHKGTATRDTAGWEVAMMKAKGQAENYVRALHADEGRPPFVVVADVGHCIELYSEFTRTGGAYVPFPDPRTHRIMMDDLTGNGVLERLRLLWTEPMALDPSRRSAKVTREIADRLARLAQSLETSGHHPKSVAGFLMRCLFTMFAEDVGLLPNRAFTELLGSLAKSSMGFQPMGDQDSQSSMGFQPMENHSQDGHATGSMGFQPMENHSQDGHATGSTGFQPMEDHGQDGHATQPRENMSDDLMLTKKEQTIHEHGLVSVLKELHDDLDRAVFDAYGWPHDLDDEAILERLVALNAERAAEERQGKIRWLRPEYQCPDGTETQTESVETAGVAAVEAQAPKKSAWPKGLAEQAQSVRGALEAFNGPATAEQVARSFKRARTGRVTELLDTLVSLGQCRALEDGRYVA